MPVLPGGACPNKLKARFFSPFALFCSLNREKQMIHRVAWTRLPPCPPERSSPPVGCDVLVRIPLGIFFSGGIGRTGHRKLQDMHLNQAAVASAIRRCLHLSRRLITPDHAEGITFRPRVPDHDVRGRGGSARIHACARHPPQAQVA